MEFRWTPEDIAKRDMRTDFDESKPTTSHWQVMYSRYLASILRCNGAAQASGTPKGLNFDDLEVLR